MEVDLINNDELDLDNCPIKKPKKSQKAKRQIHNPPKRRKGQRLSYETKIEIIKAVRTMGMTYKDIARELKVSIAAISKLAKKSYEEENFEDRLREKEDKIGNYIAAFIDIVDIFKLEGKEIENS